ncbi:PleD family two-component system response regulator [Spirosoma flavum]|uniref:Response regulator n=1 Tax=Spirosoma flavum TaxID=2048557 RepID=A0ABW6AHE2_9BACT
MNDNWQWVALLTEDEDDYAYWQYGFGCWAAHLRVEWFATGDAFFARPGLIEGKPSVLLLDGLIPMNEEPAWLNKILEHECCQVLPIIMLAGEFMDGQQQGYLNLGAAECMIKPTNQHDLQRAILSVSRYVTV